MAIEVAKEKIEGTEIVFTFDAENGEFCAWINLAQRYAKGKTLAECRTKTRGIIRRAVVKLAIPVTIVDALPDEDRNIPSWQRASKIQEERDCNAVFQATIRGLDARTGRDPLIEYEDGRRETHSRRSWDHEGTVCRRLTAEEIQRYRVLFKARWEAKDALDRFIEERKIKEVDKYVAQQIEEKIAALEAGDEEDITGDPRIDATVAGIKEQAKKNRRKK